MPSFFSPEEYGRMKANQLSCRPRSEQLRAELGALDQDYNMTHRGRRSTSPSPSQTTVPWNQNLQFSTGRNHESQHYCAYPPAVPTTWPIGDAMNHHYHQPSEALRAPPLNCNDGQPGLVYEGVIQSVVSGNEMLEQAMDRLRQAQWAPADYSKHSRSLRTLSSEYETQSAFESHELLRQALHRHQPPPTDYCSDFQSIVPLNDATHSVPLIAEMLEQNVNRHQLLQGQWTQAEDRNGTQYTFSNHRATHCQSVILTHELLERAGSYNPALQQRSLTFEHYYIGHTPNRVDQYQPNTSVTHDFSVSNPPSTSARPSIGFPTSSVAAVAHETTLVLQSRVGHLLNHVSNDEQKILLRELMQGRNDNALALLRIMSRQRGLRWPFGADTPSTHDASAGNRSDRSTPHMQGVNVERSQGTDLGRVVAASISPSCQQLASKPATPRQKQKVPRTKGAPLKSLSRKKPGARKPFLSTTNGIGVKASNLLSRSARPKKRRRRKSQTAPSHEDQSLPSTPEPLLGTETDSTTIVSPVSLKSQMYESSAPPCDNDGAPLTADGVGVESSDPFTQSCRPKKRRRSNSQPVPSPAATLLLTPESSLADESTCTSVVSPRSLKSHLYESSAPCDNDRAPLTASGTGVQSSNPFTQSCGPKKRRNSHSAPSPEATLLLIPEPSLAAESTSTTVVSPRSLKSQVYESSTLSDNDKSRVALPNANDTGVESSNLLSHSTQPKKARRRKSQTAPSHEAQSFPSTPDASSSAKSTCTVTVNPESLKSQVYESSVLRDNDRGGAGLLSKEQPGRQSEQQTLHDDSCDLLVDSFSCNVAISCRPSLGAALSTSGLVDSERCRESGCGCLATLEVKSLENQERWASVWEDSMKLNDARILHESLNEWIDQPTDSEQDIRNALLAYKKSVNSTSVSQRLVGEEDIQWWHDDDGQPSLRSLARIRRLTYPIVLRVVLHGMLVSVVQLDKTLAEYWLDCIGTRDLASRRLQKMEQELSVWTAAPDSPTEQLYQYARLKGRIQAMLRRHSTLPRSNLISLSSKAKRHRRSYPRSTMEELCEIREERIKLVREAANPSTEDKPKPFLYDGHALLTEKEDGMTEKGFLREAFFMRKVNNTLLRPFYPSESRPTFAGLSLSDSGLSKLKSVFFDKDGCLNRSCVGDVSLSVKNHFISFSNSRSAGDTDKRWQVPIRLHGTTRIKSREAVESIFEADGILHPDHETIHDLGLLIGGTEDQSLHHDISRQWTFWLPHRAAGKTDDPIVGWEINRIAYNNAMASKYAPTSVLIGMNATKASHVGVQKDQIQRCSPGECRIKWGKAYETFKIVRENDHLVVLEVPRGCMFTGDFPHAGVRNVSPGSDDEGLLFELIRKIEEILQRGESPLKTRHRVTTMLCQFKGLDRLCRLHCSTDMLDTTMQVPRNTIGYVDCWSNPADGAAKKDSSNR